MKIMILSSPLRFTKKMLKRVVEKIRRHLPALGALFVLHLAIFARLIFQTWEEVPYSVIPFDFAHGYYPWLVFIGDCLKSGIFPLWSPYVAGGTPFFINPQSQLYSPVTLIVGSTVGYTHRVAQLQTVFTLWFGGIGAYFLSYKLWRSRWAGVITAICFTFTSAVFGNLEHMTITNSVALVPWLFLLTMLTEKEGYGWSYPALAFFIYFLITSGYPGVILMVLLWLLAYTLYIIHLTVLSYRSKLRLAFGYGLTWLLGIGMAGAHWIPIVRHRKEFTRGASPLSLDEALLGGNLFFKHLWGMFFPFMTEHPLPGANPDISMSGVYFGALALPLAAGALLLIKERIVKALLLLSVGSFLMACGGFFFGRVFLHIIFPVLNMSRFPAADSRALMVFGLALLAGGGATLLQRGDNPPGRDVIYRATLVLMSVFVLSLVGLRVIVDVHTYNDIVLNYVTAEILFVGLAILALRIFSGRALMLCLATLLALEVGTCVLANMKIVGEPTWGGSYRALRDRHSRAFTPEAAEAPRIAGGTDLVANEAGEGYVRKTFYLTEYNPFRLVRFQRVIANGFTEWMTNGRRVVALAPNSRPQNYEAFQTLAQPVEYKIVSYTPNRVVYRIDAPQDSLLVFNEIYFPGWTATVDGTREEVFEAGGGFRALNVIQGSHTVVTSFKPRWFYVGLCVSLASFLLFLVWLVLLVRRERRHERAGEKRRDVQAAAQ